MPSQSWQYSSVAKMVLQYRRGGNRPITRRLLICWAQTAAVLPPMRNPRFLQQVYVYASNSRSRIRFLLDSRWDIRSHGLLHFFSCSYSARVTLFSFFLSRYPLPPRCLDKTFLNWVSSEGDACPALLGAAGFYFFDYLSNFVLL